MTVLQKRELISPGYPHLSVSDQCKLIGLQRSSYYFEPKGESVLNQQLMKSIVSSWNVHFTGWSG